MAKNSHSKKFGLPTVLSLNKVFRICRRDLSQPGVGEPNELNGYLAGTLIKIDEASNQVKSAIPGHADPDGHCLVHAISQGVLI